MCVCECVALQFSCVFIQLVQGFRRVSNLLGSVMCRAGVLGFEVPARLWGSRFRVSKDTTTMGARLLRRVFGSRGFGYHQEYTVDDINPALP